MAHRLTIRWHLRQLMATRDMFNTSDLVKPLAERGVVLSREQIYRLVTQTPQRLNLDVLAAVCDILDCQPNDLLEIVPLATAKQPKAKAAGGTPATASSAAPPVRARVRRPTGN